ncbi:MAG: hypothetical protein H7270_13685 [Dermatophilaceae bacterium]|nr:hypothetical protein [Dermatophilaceae bacterium]
MKTITTTSTTQIIRVRFASPQAADRTLAVDRNRAFDVRGGACISMHTSATSNAPAAKDVSYLRSRRPPV